MKRLFNDYKFVYTVPNELLSMQMITNKINVVATLCDLCDGIAPVITIKFPDLDIIDILNVQNWHHVKQECEEIIAKHFNNLNVKNINVVELAESIYKPQNQHYNFPNE